MLYFPPKRTVCNCGVVPVGSGFSVSWCTHALVKNQIASLTLACGDCFFSFLSWYTTHKWLNFMQNFHKIVILCFDITSVKWYFLCFDITSRSRCWIRRPGQQFLLQYTIVVNSMLRDLCHAKIFIRLLYTNHVYNLNNNCCSLFSESYFNTRYKYFRNYWYTCCDNT